MRTWAIGALIAIVSTVAPLPARPGSQLNTFVDLTYPADALTARATGAVVVRVTTDDAGRVVEAESLSGPAILRPAVVANVKQWTFKPAAGAEVVVYRFEIDHGACHDDGRSLFRLVRPNLALITACSAPGRAAVTSPEGAVSLAWDGDVPAAYPDLAISARVTGVVVLELSIDAKGAVTGVRALNDVPLLTHAAVAQVRKWRLRTPAPRQAIVVYEFALDHTDCTPRAPRPRTALNLVTADYFKVSACSPLIDV